MEKFIEELQNIAQRNNFDFDTPIYAVHGRCIQPGYLLCSFLTTNEDVAKHELRSRELKWYGDTDYCDFKISFNTVTNHVNKFKSSLFLNFNQDNRREFVDYFHSTTDGSSNQIQKIDTEISEIDDLLFDMKKNHYDEYYSEMVIPIKGDNLKELKDVRQIIDDYIKTSEELIANPRIV